MPEPPSKPRQSNVTVSNLSYHIPFFSHQSWSEPQYGLLLIETVKCNSIDTCSHHSGSWNIPNGCLSLRSRFGLSLFTGGACIFWGIPHSWLKGIPYALTCFSLWTKWAENSSQASMFVVALHWKRAKILDAPQNWELMHCKACQTLIFLVN